MNRSSFALFVALLIHLLLLLTFWILGNSMKQTHKPIQKEKKIKISLKELPKKYKKSGITKKKTVQKKTIIPPMPKGSQLKKISKTSFKKQKHKKHKKQKHKKQKHKNKKQKTKQTLTKKTSFSVKENVDINTTKLVKTTKKQNINDEMSWLYEDVSEKEDKTTIDKTSKGGSIDSNIKELYGDKFGKLTKGQQKYILDNQEIMRRITQRVLTRVAGVNIRQNLNVNRTNIIEFYLYPNGDISDFKFLKKSGYYILDDTTKETIEYAYSKYPRPTEKTLIRYNVFYNLAR